MSCDPSLLVEIGGSGQVHIIVISDVESLPPTMYNSSFVQQLFKFTGSSLFPALTLAVVHFYFVNGQFLQLVNRHLTCRISVFIYIADCTFDTSGRRNWGFDSGLQSIGASSLMFGQTCSTHLITSHLRVCIIQKRQSPKHQFQTVNIIRSTPPDRERRELSLNQVADLKVGWLDGRVPVLRSRLVINCY